MSDLTNDTDGFAIRCRTCGHPCALSYRGEWEHADDEEVYRPGVGFIARTAYDHHAIPDYIEVGEKPDSPLVSSDWPWYVAIRPNQQVADQREQHTSGE